MNLIIRYNSTGPVYGVRPDGKTIKIETSGAWLITPGSLHGSGEVYYWDGKGLHQVPTLEPDVPLSSLPLSDLILPRGIEDELRQLAAQFGFVYLIRVPAIGLGKLSLEMGRDYVPIPVHPDESFGRTQTVIQKQKHVSKPHNPK